MRFEETQEGWRAGRPTQAVGAMACRSEGLLRYRGQDAAIRVNSETVAGLGAPAATWKRGDPKIPS